MAQENKEGVFARHPMELLALLSVLVIASLAIRLTSAQREIVLRTAVQHAHHYSEAIAAFRTLYTKEVIVPALAAGMSARHDYEGRAGTLPLPATLSMALAREIGRGDSGARTSLYSPYPFPWRVADGGGLNDPFRQAAWAALSADPDTPYWRVERSSGQGLLRYATADRMRAECIACHNNHPDSPKTDWKEGQLRGVLEVSFPLDRAEALARSSTRKTVATIAPLVLLMFLGTWLGIRSRRRRTLVIAAEVKEKTASLEEERSEVLALNRDLRAASAEIKVLFDNAPLGIVVQDEGGHVITSNLAFGQMLGYGGRELRGRPFDSLMAPGAGVPSVSPKDQSPGAASTRQVRAPFLRKDGQQLWARATSRWVRDTGGASAQLLTFVEDLTTEAEAAQREDALRSQLDQARRLESIGQLAAGIAHEINTPTQYIGNNLEFVGSSVSSLTPLLLSLPGLVPVLRSADHSEEADALEQILREVEVDYLVEELGAAVAEAVEGNSRVAAIVRAMKDFSHPGSDELRAEDLNAAIRSTVTVARSEWKHVATVELALDPDLPLVPCHRNEFNQVILNLLINSSHALGDILDRLPGGLGQITIRTGVEGDSAIIEVVDNGPGIPPEIQDRIFEPFFTTKEVGSGTGQGLSVARSVIVDKHGGELSVHSSAEEGTTFRIVLPLRQVASG